MTAAFPFSAVVGMDDLRLALTLNAISPAVGGVLIRGEKGSAKSTMARGLAALLPPAAVVAGCRFRCDPRDADPDCPDGPHGPDASALARPVRITELPVGASEDRLVGALDVERALTEGVKAYEPGLLAAAHRGVLYVDEVNLLPDHLVDLLLDAAALGVCHVERDGVSVRHAARFLLVGTMNPEEGELRPQLLDRFGLTVEAAAPRDPAARALAVRRRLAFDADPAAFAARWRDDETNLAERIAEARLRLPGVVLSDAALTQIAAACAAFGVDGLRADLVVARAAAAHAAWHGRSRVGADDIRAAARLALPHRRRRGPLDSPELAEDELDRALAEAGAGGDGPRESGQDAAATQAPPGPGSRGAGEAPSGPGDGPGDGPDGEGPGGGQPAPQDGGPAPGSAAGGSGGASGRGTGGPGREGGGPGGASPDRDAPVVPAVRPEPAFRVRRLEVPGAGTGAAGRRSRARAGVGRVVSAGPVKGRPARVHVAATISAAAPHQRARGRTGPGLIVRRTDLREPRRAGRESNLLLFVVDASGSMAARARMGAVKGAVLSLLLDAYQRRDTVGVVAFRGDGAQVLLDPTSSVDVAAARLAAMPAGGRTPLAAGLLRARDVLAAQRIRDPRRRPLLVVVTDGRATDARAVGGGSPDPLAAARHAAGLLAAEGVASVVVDCESGPVRLGLAADLALRLGGAAIRLEELAAGPLADSVRVFKEAA